MMCAQLHLLVWQLLYIFRLTQSQRAIEDALRVNSRVEEGQKLLGRWPSASLSGNSGPALDVHHKVPDISKKSGGSPPARF